MVPNHQPAGGSTRSTFFDFICLHSHHVSGESTDRDGAQAVRTLPKTGMVEASDLLHFHMRMNVNDVNENTIWSELVSDPRSRLPCSDTWWCTLAGCGSVCCRFVACKTGIYCTSCHKTSQNIKWNALQTHLAWPSNRTSAAFPGSTFHRR